MTLRRALILTFIMLAAAFVAVQFSDDPSDAAKEIVIDIKGEVTLTEDITYKDGSVIVIHKDAVLDIGEFTIDFGSKSAVTIIDKATFVSSGGTIVFGEQTLVVLIGAQFSPLEEELRISFDGSVLAGGIPMIKDGSQLKFTPKDDNNVYFSWGDCRVIVQDPYASHTLTTNGVEYKVDFNKLTYITKSYDDSGKLYFVETAEVYSDLSRDAMYLRIPILDNPRAKFDVTEMTITKEYLKSGVVDTTRITDIGPTTMVIDSELIMELNASAGKMVSDKTKGDELVERSVFTDIDLYLKADFMIIKFLLKQQSIEPVKDPDIIKKLNISAVTGEFYDAEEKERYMEHLYLTIDASEEAEWFLVAGFTEDDEVNTLKAGKAQFDSFGLTTDYKLTLDVNVPVAVYSKESGDTTTFRADMFITHLVTENLDLAELYTIYSSTGELTLQELLDYSGIVKGEVNYLIIDFDGDGEADIESKELYAVLEQDAREHNTLTARFKNLEAETSEEDEKRGHTVTTYKLQESMVYLDTKGDIDEVIGAFTKGINFSADTVAEIQLSNSGFYVVSESESDRFEAEGKALSESSPANMTLSVSMTYSTYEDRTTLTLKANAVGYVIVLKDTVQHTDPVGTTDLVMDLTELTGDLDLTFDSKVSYAMGIHMPWDLSVVHYDVDFRLVNEDSDIDLTHGELAVKGYDPKNEGILAIIDDIRDNDFTVKGRLLFTSSELILSRDSVKVFNTYSDVELSIRNIVFDLHRDTKTADLDMLRIVMDLIDSDGKEHEKSLGKLNIHIDRSGTEPEPSIMESTAKMMTILFSVAIVELFIALIILRIRRSHLFKFNE